MSDSSDVHSQVVAAARRLDEVDLSRGTSGNVSARHQDGFLITPSALAYDSMEASDLVLLDAAGEVVSGSSRPSTEWPFHAAIYRSRSDVGAVVHAHPPYATALACARAEIPPFHYMIAVVGGPSVRCADYATPGSGDLARGAVAALDGRRACLLANHGMIAVGATVPGALEMAMEVENLARQYWLTIQVAEPALLSDGEIETLLRHFETYGGECD